jgi:hypothetical protein
LQFSGRAVTPGLAKGKRLELSRSVLAQLEVAEDEKNCSRKHRRKDFHRPTLLSPQILLMSARSGLGLI